MICFGSCIATAESVSQRGKVDLITSTFREKFAALAAIDPVEFEPDPSLGPLPPFRERIQDDFEPILPIEVTKAIQQLPSNKAPGPDGVLTEIYKNLPSLAPYRTLINESYRTGVTPRKLRAVHVAPLLKAGKDPKCPKSKRPITLLCGFTETTEIIENLFFSGGSLRT